MNTIRIHVKALAFVVTHSIRLYRAEVYRLRFGLDF